MAGPWGCTQPATWRLRAPLPLPYHGHLPGPHLLWRVPRTTPFPGSVGMGVQNPSCCHPYLRPEPAIPVWVGQGGGLGWLPRIPEGRAQLRQGPGRGRPLPSPRLDGAQGACSNLWVSVCPSRCLVPKPGWVPMGLGGQEPMQPPAGFGIIGRGSDASPVSHLVARTGSQESNPRRRPVGPS